MRRITTAITAVTLSLTAFLASSAAEAQRRIPINIESTPPGATVRLDSAEGQVLGTTPIRNARVPVGSHTLFFKMANHEDGQLPINVRRWRETFRVVLNPLSTIVINAANEGAQSAAVRLDGESVGNIPYRGTVQPGRHLIQISKEGFATFNQWVELEGGQMMTLPVMLEREAPQTGSLLVAGDVTGAPIFLDGEPRGVTPNVIENVPAGEHRIEIRPEGEGLETYTQQVRVVAGERLNVNPTLRPAPAQGGSLRVISNVPDAVIKLDGEVLGQAPITREGISPGEHILEAEAEGYQRVQQPVNIESGQQRVVSLRLESEARGPGRILVDAPVNGATVIIDGEERGTPPVAIDDPEPGTHTIIVQAEGYEDFRTTCRTGPGRDCEITAQMQPVGTPVVVQAPGVQGAELYVDDQFVGPIPYEGTLPVGEHRLQVRAPGFADYERHVRLVAQSTPREFNVAMTAEGEMTEAERAAAAEDRQRMREGATTHDAAPLPQDLATLDLSLGWPWIAEVRLNVGILEWLEGGFGIRTLGRLTEFEGRAKVGVRPLRQLSGAFQVRLGGGIGPGRDPTPEENQLAMGLDQDAEDHSVNSLFLSLEAMGTLHFADQGAFTLWLGTDFTSDSYDWTGANADCLLVTEYPDARGIDTEGNGCESDLPGDPRTGRQNLARLRLGGALELVINRHWNAWGLLEGILAGQGRDVFGDLLVLSEEEDTEFYFRLGVTHKF